MDRHEYEINQLINPKKDIVKSNSKHRDKIETLILGRNGIVGGAAPPKKPLLVATNYTSKKVMAGYVSNKILNIYSGGANSFNQYDLTGTYLGQIRDDDGDYCDLFMATLTDQDVSIRRWQLVEKDQTDIDMSQYEMY